MWDDFYFCVFFRPPTGEIAFDTLPVSRARGLEKEKETTTKTPNCSMWDFPSMSFKMLTTVAILVFGGVCTQSLSRAEKDKADMSRWGTE